MGERYFDVPAEAYVAGNITGHRYAGELLMAVQCRYEPHIHLNSILDEVKRPHENHLTKPNRSGAANAFLDVVKESVTFMAKHAMHADFVVARVLAAEQYQAYCIEQNAKDKATFVERMRTAKAARAQRARRYRMSAATCAAYQWCTSTGDHFDKPVEDARRRECKLIPDGVKPCLSDPATLARSAAATCAAQCRALVLYSLDAARKSAERADVAGSWDGADSDVLLALDAACDLIIWPEPLEAYPPSSSAWYRALSVVTLARRCYSPRCLATGFGRILAAIEEQLHVLPELWEHVAAERFMKGDELAMG